MKRIFVAAGMALFGLLSTACTSAEPKPVLDSSLTTATPDDVGLDSYGNRYQWESYRSTLPFAADVKESTAIEPNPARQDIFARPPSKSRAVSQSAKSRRSR